MTEESRKEAFQLTPELKKMGEEFIDAMQKHFSPNYALNDDEKIEQFHFKIVALATIAFVKTRNYTIGGLVFFLKNILHNLLITIPKDIDIYSKLEIVKELLSVIEGTLFKPGELDGEKESKLLHEMLEEQHDEKIAKEMVNKIITALETKMNLFIKTRQPSI